MKAALSILCLILLVGCEKPVELVDYSLLVHRDGITYMAYEIEPFTGDAIELHENGNLKMEHHYVNGQMNGFHRGWYDNGQLQLERHYKEGEWDGLSRWWGYFGHLGSETNYKDGKEEGIYKAWHSNGQLSAEHTFSGGKAIGLAQAWYENGQPKRCGILQRWEARWS
jgi:antitoxin component YwqK of YwqJK toxin-antitoxin module